MCPKKYKSIWIFGISKKIDTTNNTREKKDAIIEEFEIYRETKHICYTERDSYKCRVEKHSWAQIEWLFKNNIFRYFLFEKFWPTNDIERWYNLWNKEYPDQNNHTHLNISLEKEKNNRKNTVYKTRKYNHGKIILSRSELQEMLLWV